MTVMVKEMPIMKAIAAAMRRLIRRPRHTAEPQVSTDRTRHRRELTRYEGQSGNNLTVQTTIDQARTQTWTGGF